MFCPKCASAVVPGQRFCRNCGLKLDLIVDAIEGKARGPFDFEMLKRDLRDLGSSLRAGFEGAGIPFNKTQKLNQPPAPQNPQQQVVQQIWTRQFDKALRKVKAANTRKYSLQQAFLSLFGGGAMMAAWYYIFDALAHSGLIESIQHVVYNETGEYITGIVPIIEKLWLLALIPMARGVAHLVNGIFIAPKKIEEMEQEVAPAQVSAYYSPLPSAPTGNLSSAEPEGEAKAPQPNLATSVTEDETLRFEPR